MALTIALTAFNTLPALAGVDSGGGDVIRNVFLEKGAEIIDYLSTNEKGKAIASQHSLNLETLKQTLDVKFIKVVPGPLTDKYGSLVDAKFKDGILNLDRTRWSDEFLANPYVYRLVFHEMLRLTRIYNDENYIISKSIKSLDKAAIRSKSPAFDRLRKIFTEAKTPSGTTINFNERAENILVQTLTTNDAGNTSLNAPIIPV
jgi:hypothetical protein